MGCSFDLFLFGRVLIRLRASY